MFSRPVRPPRGYPRRRVRSRLALALFAAAAAGAALPAAACYRSPKRGAVVPQQQTTLRVQNQNFLDMNIYLVRGGVRSRLGTATGNSTATFRIPSSFVQALTQLAFQAHPIGGRGAPVSEEVTVSPGDEVTLIIPPG